MKKIILIAILSILYLATTAQTYTVRRIVMGNGYNDTLYLKVGSPDSFYRFNGASYDFCCKVKERNYLPSDQLVGNIPNAQIAGLGSLALSNATIPTNTNQLTNGANFLTSINSTNVTNALGFTPYNSTNPNNYISNATGLITQGTNITITGIGTSGSPYIINASGGGGGLLISNTYKWEQSFHLLAKKKFMC